MKYTLTIEADSAVKLREMLRAATQEMHEAARNAIQSCGVRDVPERELTDDEIASLPTPSQSFKVVERATLPTGDSPSDVYGPGNGPVDAYRPPADLPKTTDQIRAAPEPHDTPTTDANNMPWDERIHAGSKTLNADGTWRKKRGVSDELVRSVEAYAVGNEPVPEPVLVGAQPHACIGVDLATKPDMTVYTEVSEDGKIYSLHTPASIMSRIAALVTSGDKTPTYVQELVKSCDLTDGIAQIASDSDALERVVAALQAEGVL